jgi:hypothetical protein
MVVIVDEIDSAIEGQDSAAVEAPGSRQPKGSLCLAKGSHNSEHDSE